MTHRLLRWLPWLLSAALLAGVIRLVPISEVAAALRQLRPGEVAVLIFANGVVLLAITAVLRWRIVPADAARQALGLVAALLAVPVLYVAATSAGRFPAARLTHRLARARLLRPLAARLSAAAAVVEAGEQQVGAFYRRAPAAFAAALGITLLGWLALVGEFWLMIHFLGLDLTLPQLVTTLTAARLSILLLLPAGLGALELSQAMAFGALGLDPGVGIAAGLLIRARDTLLAGFGLWWGGRRLAKRRVTSDE